MSTDKIRQLYDNIYGFIDFDKALFDDILRNPFFLRLHNLKQMGLTYYVYPDALHTRYAHSLGVYSIANRIIGAGKDLIPALDQNKILISALLHDIGHLPLSHTIEAALEEFEELEQKLDEVNNINKNEAKDFFVNSGDGIDVMKPSIVEDSLSNNCQPKVALHERLGEVVLGASGIPGILIESGIDDSLISAGFKGDINFESEIPPERRTFYAKHIRNFLHSQLDADRIDYILRDSGFSGVKTGSFDIDKLLNSIVFDHDSNYGIEISGIRALEQFFMSRFVGYCQIVGNKKVMAFEYMAKDFYFRLLKLRKEQKYHLGIRLYSYRDLVEDVLVNRPEEFLSFTDDYFFSLVREVLDKKDQIVQFDSIVVKYAEMITNVQPLCPVIYLEVFTDLKNGKKSIMELLRENEEILDEVAKEANVDSEEIIIPKHSKIKMYRDDEDPVQVFNRGEVICSNVSEFQSCLLQHLSNNQFEIHRVYTFDKKNVVKLKESILKAVEKYCPTDAYNYY